MAPVACCGKKSVNATSPTSSNPKISSIIERCQGRATTFSTRPNSAQVRAPHEGFCTSIFNGHFEPAGGQEAIEYIFAGRIIWDADYTLLKETAPRPERDRLIEGFKKNQQETLDQWFREHALVDDMGVAHFLGAHLHGDISYSLNCLNEYHWLEIQLYRIPATEAKDLSSKQLRSLLLSKPEDYLHGINRVNMADLAQGPINYSLSLYKSAVLTNKGGLVSPGTTKGTSSGRVGKFIFQARFAQKVSILISPLQLTTNVEDHVPHDGSETAPSERTHKVDYHWQCDMSLSHLDASEEVGGETTKIYSKTQWTQLAPDGHWTALKTVAKQYVDEPNEFGAEDLNIAWASSSKIDGIEDCGADSPADSPGSLPNMMNAKEVIRHAPPPTEKLEAVKQIEDGLKKGKKAEDIVSTSILGSFRKDISVDELKFGKIQCHLYAMRTGMSERKDTATFHIAFNSMDKFQCISPTVYVDTVSAILYHDGKKIGQATMKLLFQCSAPLINQRYVGVMDDDGKIQFNTTVIGQENKIVDFKKMRNHIPLSMQTFYDLHKQLTKQVNQAIEENTAGVMALTNTENNYSPSGRKGRRSSINTWLKKDKAKSPTVDNQNLYSEANQIYESRRQEISKIMNDIVKLLCGRGSDQVPAAISMNRRMFEYHSMEGLITAQRMFINFANHCITTLPTVPKYLRITYLNALTNCLKRLEFATENLLPICTNKLLRRGNSSKDHMFNFALLSLASRLYKGLQLSSEDPDRTFPLEDNPDFAGVNIKILPLNKQQEEFLSYTTMEWIARENVDFDAIVSDYVTETKAQMKAFFNVGAHDYDCIDSNEIYKDVLSALKSSELRTLGELTIFEKRIQLCKQFYLLLWKLLFHTSRTVSTQSSGRAMEYSRRFHAMFSFLGFLRITPWRNAVLANILTPDEKTVVIDEWDAYASDLGGISARNFNKITTFDIENMLLEDKVEINGQFTLLLKRHKDWVDYERLLLRFFGRRRMVLAIATTLSELDDNSAGGLLDLKKKGEGSYDGFAQMSNCIPKPWLSLLLGEGGERGPIFYSMVESMTKFILLQFEECIGDASYGGNHTDAVIKGVMKFPGYAPFLKALLLDLKTTPVSKYSDALKTASAAMLTVNPNLLNVYMKIMFSRTSVHNGINLFECLTTMDTWFQVWSTTNMPWPECFDSKLFLEAMRICLDSDISLNQQKTIWFIYKNGYRFTGKTQEKILNLIVRKCFTAMMLHWAPAVRKNYIQLILFRLVEPIRKYLTDKSIRAHLKLDESIIEPINKKKMGITNAAPFDSLRNMYFKRVEPPGDELFIYYYWFCKNMEFLNEMIANQPGGCPEPKEGMISRANLFSAQSNENMNTFRDILQTKRDFWPTFVECSKASEKTMNQWVMKYPDLKHGEHRETVASYILLLGSPKGLGVKDENFENGITTSRLSQPLPALLHQEAMKTAIGILKRDGKRLDVCEKDITDALHMAKHSYITQPDNRLTCNGFTYGPLGMNYVYSKYIWQDAEMQYLEYWNWMSVIQMQRCSVNTGYLFPSDQECWKEGSREAVCKMTNLLTPMVIRNMHLDQNTDVPNEVEEGSAGAGAVNVV